MRNLSAYEISIFLFSLICCSGFSALMPLRVYLIIIVMIIMIMCNLTEFRLVISKSPVLVWYILFVIYISLGIFYSFQKVQTAKYLVMYLAGASIIILPTKSAFHEKCIAYVEMFCKFIAASIIIQIIIPNLYSKYLYFLIRGGAAAKSRLRGEVANHIYSGIVGEKGEAAFLMVVAIIIVLGKCVSENKVSHRNLSWLIVYFAALLLPAKRMLFVVAILIFMLYMLFWNNGNKRIIAVGGFGACACIGYFVMSVIPSMNTLLSRFTSFVDDDTGNGRIYLWEHALNMFHEKPFLGHGYGTYNAYASNKGVILTQSRDWISHAHNIYYQMLGEIGIVGIILFCLVTLSSLFIYYKLYKLRKNIEAQDIIFMFMGSNLLIMVLVYGLTGNIIYYTNQIMFYFWGISISVFLYKKYLRKNMNKG